MPKYTSRDGQQLHYLDVGKGPVCLLLHGFGMQAKLWLPFVLPLSRKYRFILPDFRGFAGSVDASHIDANIFEQFAHDLEDLMTTLDISNVALGGYSMGGTTAMMYQRLYGTQRLRSCLLIDQAPVIHNDADFPWGLYGKHQAEKFSHFDKMFAAIDEQPEPDNWRSLPRELRTQIYQSKSFFIDSTFDSPVGIAIINTLTRLKLTRLMINQRNWPAYLHCMQAYTQLDIDFRNNFAGYDIPLWVFAATQSRLYPIEGQRLFTQLVEDTTMIEFDGVGHALPFECPRVFTRHLDEYIQSNLGRDTGKLKTLA